MENNQISSPLKDNNQNDGRPFLIVVTILITIVILQSTVGNSLPIEKNSFILGLAGVHIGLHWLFSRVPSRWQWGLLLIQMGIALGLVLISGSPDIALPIFAALVGATIGTMGITPLSIGMVGGSVILNGLAYYLVGGLTMFLDWRSPFLSTMLLLTIFMVFYRRELEARQHSQALAQKLESANRKLAIYADQVEELTLNNERQRMARELHDTLAQGVAGLVLQLEGIKAHQSEGNTERVTEIVLKALERARGTLADSRLAIDDLRAGVIDLEIGIRTRVQHFNEVSGLVCEVSLPTEKLKLSNQAREELLQIVSEGLTNITRHANASEVSLSLKTDAEQIQLEIRDNGIGFNPKQDNAGHYGLLGIQERAELLGGTALIESRLNEGTKIIVEIPSQEGE